MKMRSYRKLRKNPKKTIIVSNTHLAFQKVSRLIAQVLKNLFSSSSALDIFTHHFKLAHKPSLLKKPNIDISDESSYRLISNFSILNGLFKELVPRRVSILRKINFFIAFIRLIVFTTRETAIPKVYSD